MTRGRKLFYLRQRLGLSLNQAASLMGISDSTLCRYEQDEFFCNEPELLIRICRLYQVPADYLEDCKGRDRQEGRNYGSFSRDLSLPEVTAEELMEHYLKLDKRAKIRVLNLLDIKKSQLE